MGVFRRDRGLDLGARPSTDGPRLVLTPRRDVLGRGAAARAAIFLPAVAVGFFGSRGNALPGWVTWTVVGLGLLIGIAAIGLMVARVEVTDRDLVVRRLVGLKRRTPLPTLTRVVLVQDYEQYASPLAAMLTVVAQARRPVLRLSGHVYAADDLAALARRLGSVEVITEAITPQLLEQRHPGLVPFWERRPWTVAWVVVGLTVVGATVVGILAER